MIASAPLNIGVVGLNFGRHILPQLRDEHVSRFFRLSAVCDLDTAKADEWAARYQVPTYYSLDALLTDPDIRVIGLFTSPQGRANLLRQIIRSGKDVMTTKPFELEPRAAREVLDEAAALGRVIHLNSPAPQPTAAFSKIREWEKKFNLGRPIFCRGESTADYHEQADGSWYDDLIRCPVAPIFRLGIYLINELTSLFGPVCAVQVLANRVRTGRPTPDNAQLGLQFANGALGSIYASFCVSNGQHYADSLLLHYEGGTIQFNLDPVAFGQASKISRLRLITIAPGEERVVTEEWRSPGSIGDYQWQALHDAIINHDITSMPVESIISGIQVIQAMARSVETGKTEEVEA